MQDSRVPIQGVFSIRSIERQRASYGARKENENGNEKQGKKISEEGHGP